MKKRIIATVLTAACALTGCSTSVPDLSKLDVGKASEYMAGELLKHDSKYAYGLDYDRSILNPTPTPTPIVTPAPAPTETAAVQSAEPGQVAAGKDGEAEATTVPLTKLYGIPGVSVDFVSAKLKSSLGADYAYCKVGKGKKLLVLYFRIKNTGNTNAKVDLHKNKPDFYLRSEGKQVGLLQHTVANGELQYFQQKIKAGDNRQGVLVFEVDQEINLSDVSLVAVRDDKQAEIAIK